ncbi:hypothetical protein LOK49_LG15G00581 [Camellia lanceoleosa]|uniref:Uncharacterized protein n=1 Tax=Camellia lanceoleosa TaxID=1840588 RepID=A0ACC0F3G6_9ERIC|nr:hypothetical protein LOK49_LG15G00581 [Camellia lanceoleosa]
MGYFVPENNSVIEKKNLKPPTNLSSKLPFLLSWHSLILGLSNFQPRKDILIQ